MSNVLGFIPARKNSKGIPGKNLKELGGRPLLAWTVECAFRSGLQRVVVSTDGADIAAVARQYGAEVLDRPAELAGDRTSMFDVLRSEVARLDPLPEIVVLLQPTSPFRNSTQVRTALSFFVENLDRFDSLISVQKVPEIWNPAQVIVQTPLGPRMANGCPIAQRATRRQDHPEAWVPNGSVYVFKTSNLEKGSLYGERTMLFETGGELNINGPEDFAQAVAQLEHQNG